MVEAGRDQAYQPAAMAMLAWGLTWICLGLLQYFSRGRASAQQLTGR